MFVLSHRFFPVGYKSLTSACFLLSAGLSSSILPFEVRASSSSANKSISGEYLVKVHQRAHLNRFAQEKGLLVDSRMLLSTPEGDWYKIVDASGAFNLSQLFNPSVQEEFAILASEPNRVWRLLGPSLSFSEPPDPTPTTPARLPRPSRSDPQVDKLWGLKTIAAPLAWKLNIGNQRVVVGMIDTGIDYNHEDLNYNIWRNRSETPNDGIDNDNNGFVDDDLGWDFSNDDNRPWDDQGHGTHTAGTVGAVGGNGLGISGLSQRVSLISLKFLSRDGTGTTENAIRAINYGVAAGAHILSNSWGGDEYSQALEEAISAAAQKDVLFVAAAGNDSSDNDEVPMFPASYRLPNVISVAASDRYEQLADFSNYGAKTVDLVAPGDVILSTVPGNRYSYMSGTSMACPLVAGAAALLKSLKPDLTAQQLKRLLVRSVDRLDVYDGMVLSGGRLNALRALQQDDVVE